MQIITNILCRNIAAGWCYRCRKELLNTCR